MTRQTEDIRRDLSLIRERERWSDIHHARITQLLDDVLVLLAGARAAEAREAELRARLEAVEKLPERDPASATDDCQYFRREGYNEGLVAARAALAAPSPQEAGQ